MRTALLATVLLVLASTSASALNLQGGPQIGQYWNFENLYTGADLAAPGSGFYIRGGAIKRTDVDGPVAAGDFYLGDNWGVLRLNSLQGLNGQYYADFNDASPAEEVTGIFYGIDVTIVTPIGPGFTVLRGTGGRFDLYNEASPTAATRFRTGSGVRNFEFSPASLGLAAGLPTYKSATEGTRVASFLMADGIGVLPGVNVIATFLAGLPSNGSASGYLNVIPDLAPWAAQLDTDGFSTIFGPRDALNKNSFFASAAGAIAVGGLHGWDLFSSDPFQINPTPEPGTFALLGLGLVGLGFAARRRRRS